MALGYIYEWEQCQSEFTGGQLNATTAPLSYLDAPRYGKPELSGRYVEILNMGRINENIDGGSCIRSILIGNASSNSDGNFFFKPCRGGGTLGKSGIYTPEDRERNIEGSRFGEVNAYYHLTRIAERVEGLLRRLGEKPLPRVRAIVDAHLSVAKHTDRRFAVPDENGIEWRPVRGAHYRFPENWNVRDEVDKHDSWTGEILLGPAIETTNEGWLPRVAGEAYSCKPSHDAGYMYQAFAHHITRYTADFQANALRSPYRQSNAKSSTEIAVSRYLAASLMGTPHLQCWRARHDPDFVHPSSLLHGSPPEEIDAAGNGGSRIASALWHLRHLLKTRGNDCCDLLVLAALLGLGTLYNRPYRPTVRETRSLRRGGKVLGAALLHADKIRFGGRNSDLIKKAFERQRIEARAETFEQLAGQSAVSLSVTMSGSDDVRKYVNKIRDRAPDGIFPNDDEMIPPGELELLLRTISDKPYHLVAVGDVMTGGRMRRRLADHGSNYPFAWVKPVFDRSSIVLANLEAPFARTAEKESTTRNFAYRVNPNSAHVLRRAGINVVTVANNHMMDCGHEGVRETLETLARQGIPSIGGGLDEVTAHDPAILSAGARKIGLLGYYWNSRTAARNGLPGSARDLPELVQRDIEKLKQHVDRVVVTVHWGVPYERQPTDEDRKKARHFIDCGADIVVGHHPHIMQAFEVYRGRPIFYSVGNFAFGSGNSKAESLVVAVRFSDDQIEVDLFPAYVRNRDPRLDYQPKLMCGTAALRTLDRLVSISGDSGKQLQINEFYGRLRMTPVDRRVAKDTIDDRKLVDA